MAGDENEWVLDLRRLAAAIGTPSLPRRSRKDEERWSAELERIASGLAAAPAPEDGRYTQADLNAEYTLGRKDGFEAACTPLTYANQPDNVGAWRLGEACRHAKAGGDPIDHGLSLLKELQSRGYGVVALAQAERQGESE